MNQPNDHRSQISTELTVGQLAERSGVSVSALHFYERQGLISSRRTEGNQRRYRRDTLRRVAFVRVSQRVGMSLADIRTALDDLPKDARPAKPTGSISPIAGALSSICASNRCRNCATS